jgi:hypothetical protein
MSERRSTHILFVTFDQFRLFPNQDFPHSVFHRLRQAKFAYGGSILSLSQFSIHASKNEACFISGYN